MFTDTAEYALRAVVYLASRPGETVPTADVAGRTKVPPAYLAKVLQELARAGVVRSQRGPGGGVALARPAADLTVLDVVNAVDPVRRIRTCPLGLASHGARLCPLHKRLDAALAQVEAAFAATTVAEVLAEPTTSTPLCEVPPSDRQELNGGARRPV